jgi:hypothetical protein
MAVDPRFLARLGRAAKLTEDELIKQLAPLGPSEDLRRVVHETFAIPDAEFHEAMRVYAKSIVEAKDLIEAGKGKNVDFTGKDEAVRLAVSIGHAIMGLPRAPGN